MTPAVYPGTAHSHVPNPRHALPGTHAPGFSTVREVSKWQAVRLFDVFLLGPFMIVAGVTHPHRNVRAALIAAGIGTIILNGVNWIRQQRIMR